MFLQVVEAEPGEGLVQAPRDVVDIEAPVTENLTTINLESEEKFYSYAYGSSEYLGGVHPMAHCPFSLLMQIE